ncbi:MAG: hypothetical protein J5771_00800 [Bacteroidales bacterium]|nr:hypothetical protein [Bacteroidales bacterium]
MKILKTLLSTLLLLLLAVSCERILDILPVDKCSFVEFNNKTNIPIYFIADVQSTDGVITSGSNTVLCKAKNIITMDFPYKQGLKQTVKDSAHIYCLDARLSGKLGWYYKELPDTTAEKAFIARITYIPNSIRIVFPQPEGGYKTLYNASYYEEVVSNY